MIKTCPDCQATVLSTSQPIKEATAAQHFDLRKGEPARFVRNGILETCQCRDCAALAATPTDALAHSEANCRGLRQRAEAAETKLATLAATPAVGGEAVNDIVRKIVYQMSPADQYDLAFKVAENVGYILVREAEHPDSPHLAAPPASPLRGMEIDALRKIVFQQSSFELEDNELLIFEGATLTQLWRLLLDAALSISPPEQPAAVQDTYFTEDRFLGRCQHCLDNAYFRDEAQLCERDPECLIRREREARATAPPFQPHENCNCLMCLAEKPRDEP